MYCSCLKIFFYYPNHWHCYSLNWVIINSWTWGNTIFCVNTCEHLRKGNFFKYQNLNYYLNNPDQWSVQVRSRFINFTMHRFIGVDTKSASIKKRNILFTIKLSIQYWKRARSGLDYFQISPRRYLDLYIPPCTSLDLYIPPCTSLDLFIPPCTSLDLSIPPCTVYKFRFIYSTL